MRRFGYGVFFLLVGVLFPVLIWVALFVAIRKPVLQTAKRIAAAILALLTGILFPVLIWVALFVAVRKPVLQTVKRVAAAALALLTGTIFPVLIWVGFATTIRELLLRWKRRVQRESGRTIAEILAVSGLPIQWETTGGRSLAAAVFAKRPMSEIQELLARAGL